MIFSFISEQGGNLTLCNLSISTSLTDRRGDNNKRFLHLEHTITCLKIPAAIRRDLCMSRASLSLGLVEIHVDECYSIEYRLTCYSLKQQKQHVSYTT